MAIKGTKPINPINGDTEFGKKLIEQLMNPEHRELTTVEKDIAKLFAKKRKKTA